MPKDASYSKCSLLSGLPKSKHILESRIDEPMDTITDKQLQDQSLERINEEWNAAAAKIKLLINEKSKGDFPRMSLDS